jgi:hypothetical protein
MSVRQPLQHFPLPFGHLRLDGWCHRKPGIRDTDTIQILARSGERDWEITGVRANERLTQTVVGHLVAHPAEPAASFLNAVEIGKTLGQHRFAGAGPVFAPAQIGESDGRRRQAGTGDNHAVSEVLDDDFPPSVLVLTMGHSVGQGLPCITVPALFEHPSLLVGRSAPDLLVHELARELRGKI